MRHRTLVAMLGAHALVVALAAAFYFRARVAIDEAYRADATPMSPATRLALATWFLPAAVGLGVALAVAAGVLPLKRSRRMRLWATGIVVASIAFVFAVIAVFVPLFHAAG